MAEVRSFQNTFKLVFWVAFIWASPFFRRVGRKEANNFLKQFVSVDTVIGRDAYRDLAKTMREGSD